MLCLNDIVMMMMMMKLLGMIVEMCIFYSVPIIALELHLLHCLHVVYMSWCDSFCRYIFVLKT